MSAEKENTEFAVVATEGWFDGERHHPESSTFHIRQGRVASIASGNYATTLAGQGIPVFQGGFLLPGLVDAHVHLFLDGAPTDGKLRSEHMKKSVEELTETARLSARQSLNCGVTLVRDAGDRHGINHRVRGEAEQAPDLCRIRSGGSGIKREKRYGAFMARDVADEAGIRELVSGLARTSDEIKIILTGIIDFDAGAVTDEPQFTLDEAKLVVATAHGCGRKTFAHCSGIKGLSIAANAGVGSIEHGFFMDRETLGIMRDKQIAWTPTFCPVHFQWAHPEAVGWSANTVGHLRRILDGHAEHLRLAHDMGVPLLLGTDAGSMGVEHGYALFDEIDRYLDAGIPLPNTLQATTAAARRHFGMDHPLLCKNSLFAAVLLNQSPFTNIKALREPVKVWKGWT
ncbi:MAG: amidohydrolase family protein [Sulfuritalea sp.]|nr:amidohydrolase family protein [Sulfuritalea sp.]